MRKKRDLSIVVPVYGCEKTLAPLLNRIQQSLKTERWRWELILVNDGSRDAAWRTITRLARTEKRVVGINLSRNFGQHAAIMAGLTHAVGGKIVVMDCDLQDRPEEIPALVKKTNEGYDVVLARRHNRRDSFLKKISSRGFYFLLDRLTGHQHDPAVANFGCYDYKVIVAVLRVNDKCKSFPLFVRWVGFSYRQIFGKSIFY